MTIQIKAVQKVNPRDLLATPKFYAQAVRVGIADIDRLCKLVSDGSTVRQADVYAVIVGLMNAIQDELEEGKSIDLGKLGRFSISVRSEGVDNADLVNASTVKGAKVLYSPSKEFKKMLKALDYTRI